MKDINNNTVCSVTTNRRQLLQRSQYAVALAQVGTPDTALDTVKVREREREREREPLFILSVALNYACLFTTHIVAVGTSQ